MKTVKGLKSWITKTKNKNEEIPFCWANVGKKFDQQDLNDLFGYCEKNGFRFAIVVNGINPLRPQRTWFGLPEWFRNNTERHDLFESDNAFCFVGMKDSEEEERKTLFDNAKQIENEVTTCEVIIWVNKENLE